MFPLDVNHESSKKSKNFYILLLPSIVFVMQYFLTILSGVFLYGITDRQYFVHKTFSNIFAMACTSYTNVLQINISAQLKTSFLHNGLLYVTGMEQMGEYHVAVYITCVQRMMHYSIAWSCATQLAFLDAPSRHERHEICALLGCYAASCGNCLPTFQDNVSVPSSRVKSTSRLRLLTLEDGTNTLFQNVGKQLPQDAK
jgi:hypothetical protein